jgi:hypothetical protein
MIPPNLLHAHVLALAETVSILLAYKLTPESLRQILLNFTKELKTELSPEALKAVEAAEAKATIRALTYRRED